MLNLPDNKRYDGLHGLRSMLAIGIIIFHVYCNYIAAFENSALGTVFLSFKDLVFPFMTISAFSMCCGYYDRVMQGKISYGVFYRKRFEKILPFFAIISIAEVAVDPCLDTLYQLFANLTLCFGFLPNYEMTVVGIGWFLGVLFIFYFVFPFFCSLLEKKWKAWIAFGISIALTMLCEYYFFQPEYAGFQVNSRHNFLYCAPFFLAGGLVYLYREQIAKFSKKYWYIMLLILACAIAYYYGTGWALSGSLLIAIALVCIAIGVERQGVLNNPIAHFLSGISLEIYLCQMMSYQVLSLLRLNKLFGNTILSFVVSCVLNIALTIGIVFAIKFGFSALRKIYTSLYSKWKRSPRETEK